MEDIKSAAQLFSGYTLPVPLRSRRTERGDLISYFHERLSAHQKAEGRRVWSIKEMGYFLSIYPTGELYVLRMKCDSAKNFCACLLWHLFPKKG